MKFRIEETPSRIPDRFTPQVKLSCLKPWQNIDEYLNTTENRVDPITWEKAQQTIQYFLNRNCFNKIKKGNVTYHYISTPYMIPRPTTSTTKR